MNEIVPKNKYVCNERYLCKEWNSIYLSKSDFLLEKLLTYFKMNHKNATEKFIL